VSRLFVCAFVALFVLAACATSQRCPDGDRVLATIDQGKAKLTGRCSSDPADRARVTLIGSTMAESWLVCPQPKVLGATATEKIECPHRDGMCTRQRIGCVTPGGDP